MLTSALLMVGEHALFPGMSPAGDPIGHSKSSIPPAGGAVFPLEKSLFFRVALAPLVPVVALFLLGLMSRGTRDPMKRPWWLGCLVAVRRRSLSLSLRRLSTRIDMEIRDSRSCGSSSGARWSLMVYESPFRKASINAGLFQPLSVAMVRNSMA